MNRIIWERSNHAYTNSILGKVGKYQFFSIVWDSSSSNRDKPEKLFCRLPGIKDHIANFATQEEAKERAERVLELWLNNSGLIAQHGIEKL